MPVGQRVTAPILHHVCRCHGQHTAVPFMHTTRRMRKRNPKSPLAEPHRGGTESIPTECWIRYRKGNPPHLVREKMQLTQNRTTGISELIAPLHTRSRKNTDYHQPPVLSRRWPRGEPPPPLALPSIAPPRCFRSIRTPLCRTPRPQTD